MESLNNNDGMFIKSDRVKYNEDITFLIFENILKKTPIITLGKLGLFYEYLEMEKTERNVNIRILEIQVSVVN